MPSTSPAHFSPLTPIVSPPSFSLPRTVRLVRDFAELAGTPFRDGVNALCWPRVLDGDFAAVAAGLEVPRGLTHLDADLLGGLSLDQDGRRAVAHMQADLERLRGLGLDPVLECVNGYTHPLLPPHLRTDVCSFHADSATAEADTWLCTYHGACSEGLPDDHALRRADHPASRRALLAAFGGGEGAAFEAWLEEHFHDLHYLPRPGAVPYAFGVFHLWRIATRHPGCAVPPCIHRAPYPVPGQRRLLLIS